MKKLAKNDKVNKNDFLHGFASVFPEDENQSPQTVYFIPPKTRKYPLNWLLLWQTSSDIGVSLMEQACSEKPLTQVEYRVRDYLLGTIGVGNMVYVNQAEIARQLNIRAASVCNAIKELVRRKIVILGPKSGKNNTYMISPAFCFSGSLQNGITSRKLTIKNEKSNILYFDKNKDNS